MIAAIMDKYYESTLSSLSPTRDKMMRYHLSRFLVLAGKKDLNEVSNNDCLKYIQFIRNFGYAPKTINDISGQLRRVLNIYGLHYLDHLRPIPGQSIPHGIFTDDEIALMLKTSDGLARDILIPGLFAGLRSKDICNLLWSSYDPPFLRFIQFKTKAPIAIPAAKELVKLIESKKRTSEYIFPTLQERYRKDTSLVSYTFRAFLHKIGIKNTMYKPQNYRNSVNIKGIHSLRHTFLYKLAMSGLPYPVILRYAGHIDPKTLQTYINHLSDEDLKRYFGQFTIIGK